ncbi:uncharacterized protein DUF91 [Christiangramia gaetbulicola]|uniref:Uncharacterized protein DUF91 n=1 Tax=Christiangramia gaetbulicola TaxID=703340 RepID=A0A2T6AKD1_9FLAO|nr:DUF4268 domain-containing protein [Christiangramia gaetbulicola]PTX44186.1 uncharacterized protein DUF91 [Christiangramia gaetbulicola]
MYRINKDKNNIAKLEERLFSDLKIRERENLQEWIAKNPDMLGEDLLIIQKEFDGFNDTHERLDLLAIDKEGGLVIIENKLDDTGRDVVWQALKYTSYCSTLTNQQIIKIYQSYLNSYEGGGNAKENLLEFLERDEEDLLLNKNDQRIIFVANKYRKEVTSTVLWLLAHDIQIQCFRAIPYTMADEAFLQIEQIIPLPETREFMIDAMEKEKEERSKSMAVAETEARMLDLWTKLKQRLSDQNINYLDRVSAKHYFDLGFSKGSGRFAFCVGRDSVRVELYFSNDPEKLLIDEMSKHKEKIEQQFGNELVFERLDGKKASRIRYDRPISPNENYSVSENRDEYIDWFIPTMKQFYEATYPILEKVQNN